MGPDAPVELLHLQFAFLLDGQLPLHLLLHPADILLGTLTPLDGTPEAIVRRSGSTTPSLPIPDPSAW
jgi:hypothetical protein